MIFSPLKESHDFNKYVKTLRVKMTKRVRKTNKSPEDQQESGSPTRVRKTTKGKNKKHEDQRKPARVRKSSRVKEDCQVPRIQKSKSLEDWHHLRVKTQEDDSPISPPTRGGDRERGRERHP
jgi:CHAD domain-containing protein